MQGVRTPPPPPPPPPDDLRFSHTTGILQKKKMWSIDVEVGQETSALPPKKNPGSAPEVTCKGHPSSTRTVTSGVFQGSILKPLLFIEL